MTSSCGKSNSLDCDIWIGFGLLLVPFKLEELLAIKSGKRAASPIVLFELRHLSFLWLLEIGTDYEKKLPVGPRLVSS